MATIAALAELQPTDHRRPRNAGNDQGRDTPAPPEHVLENTNATPREEALTRITSLPDIRRHKVLDIRRQLAEGTYEVADRLAKTIDRILEATTT